MSIEELREWCGSDWARICQALADHGARRRETNPQSHAAPEIKPLDPVTAAAVERAKARTADYQQAYTRMRRAGDPPEGYRG